MDLAVSLPQERLTKNGPAAEPAGVPGVRRGPLVEQRGKLICSKCRTICETCCEGGRG